MPLVPEPSIFSADEANAIDQFLKTGYIIFPVEDLDSLAKIRRSLYENAVKALELDSPPPESGFFDNAQKFIPPDRLNMIRLGLIDQLNKNSDNAALFYSLAKKHLGWIVGNEMAIQRSYNLGIQLPQDGSAILPLHSDVWSGCSAYEVVLWIPMVDVSKTKSMFILPKKTNEIYYKKFNKYKDTTSLQKAIDKKVKWLNIKFGQGLIFAHHLMHGNKVNITNETRWSFNCRFKSLMSPYDKKDIAETFFPLIVRPATRVGLEYEHPQI